MQLKNRHNETRLINMYFQLGKYILASYLKRQQETGQMEQTFIIKVTQQNGHQLSFKVEPVEKQ